MLYEEFLAGTKAVDTTETYAEYQRVEAIYMQSDLMTKEDAYRMAKVETVAQRKAKLRKAQKAELQWVLENIIPAAAFIRGMSEKEDIEECIIADFTAMFHSFRRPEKETWLDRDTRVLLESKLFVIGLVDNEWSMAVELLQKEEPWGDIWMENLQKIHYQKYLEGLKKAMLWRLPSIGTYKGAWTSGRLTREEAMTQ